MTVYWHQGAPAAFSSALPNDGVALYGSAAAYRLRVLTTGGFSPDGVRSVYPTEFARYFRVLTIDGGTLSVLGLADLGLAMSPRPAATARSTTWAARATTPIPAPPTASPARSPSSR